MLTIYYPGNHGQVCVANVAVVANPTESFMHSNILITEALDNIGQTFASFDAQLISILNKVFDHHLSYCRYDLVSVYYATRTSHDLKQFEALNKIEFKLNMLEFCEKNSKCSKTYKRRFFKRFVTQVSTTSYEMTLGSCTVEKVELMRLNPNSEEYKNVISQFNTYFN
jgi:hypothetical protein